MQERSLGIWMGWRTQSETPEQHQLEDNFAVAERIWCYMLGFSYAVINPARRATRIDATKIAPAIRF